MGTNSRFGGLQNSFRISTTIVEQLDILYPSLINRRLWNSQGTRTVGIQKQVYHPKGVS